MTVVPCVRDSFYVVKSDYKLLKLVHLDSFSLFSFSFIYFKVPIRGEIITILTPTTTFINFCVLRQGERSLKARNSKYKKNPDMQKTISPE